MKKTKIIVGVNNYQSPYLRFNEDSNSGIYVSNDVCSIIGKLNDPQEKIEIAFFPIEEMNGNLSKACRNMRINKLINTNKRLLRLKENLALKNLKYKVSDEELAIVSNEISPDTQNIRYGEFNKEEYKNRIQSSTELNGEIWHSELNYSVGNNRQSLEEVDELCLFLKSVGNWGLERAIKKYIFPEKYKLK